MIPNRLFDLYYGQSGTGKSRAAAQMAYQIHKATDKKVRVLVGDGSLQTYDALINAGIVEGMEFSHRPYPFDVCQRITEGWFPADQFDPTSPLVPPDKNGHFNIGGYIIEGAAVMGAYVMSGIEGGLAQLSAEGHKIGQDTPYQIPQGKQDTKGNFVSGPGSKFGGNPMAHYNVAQKLVTDSVQRSKMLSRYVIWTSHEQTNDPEKSQLVKELICGPEVVGRTLTASFQRMFGNTLHFQTVANKRNKIKDDTTGRDMIDLDLDYRIWTRDHFSPDQNTMIRYKALTRGVEGLEPYYDDILTYYKNVSELSAKSLDIVNPKQ